MKDLKYSVIIIGSGISGLYSALKIEQQLKSSENILLVTKSELNNCNSYYAQGGMVAVLEDNKNDSVELHISDTLKAGAGLGDFNTIKFISEKSNSVVKDLLNFGVEFDTDESGNFTLTKEGAHSVNRILHSGGDATGREMEMALINSVRKNKNITIMENTMVVELLVSDNTCAGIITYNKNNKEYNVIYSDSTILATGGLGQLYQYTTNPIGATADGFSISYKSGAILQDMEFVQFHPTALAFDDNQNHNRFLISEAVRGEGAKLIDKNGNSFMEQYHENKELAPRDIVARAIFDKMHETNSDYVYLDATSIGKEKLLKRFPTIAQKCLEYNIDITKDYIPVSPVAHYFMGGIKTDVHGKTSINNLYAIGEVSSTGLHGANRLASNSLLECVVCAYEVSKSINDSKNFLCPRNFPDDIGVENKQATVDCLKNKNEVVNSEEISSVIEKYEQLPKYNIDNSQEIINTIKSLMWDKVGIYRDEKSLISALEQINSIKYNEWKCSNALEYEMRNMIICAKLIINSAIRRKESRGAHYRSDYLTQNDNCNHTILSKKEGELNFVK